MVFSWVGPLVRLFFAFFGKTNAYFFPEKEQQKYLCSFVGAVRRTEDENIQES